MAITVELAPELEEQLREKATAKGLTVEGYLLTLIETVVQPQTRSHKRHPAFKRLFPFLKTAPEPHSPETQDPDQRVREALRQMRESILAYKEQAVEAVTLMNMLRSAVDQQERLAAEKELQAMGALKTENIDRARKLWQEKWILERHLEQVRQELTAATEAAGAIIRVFQQEEERARKRASKAQETAIQAYRKAMLTPEQLSERMGSLETDTEWHETFEQWGLDKTSPPSEITEEEDLATQDPVPDLEAYTQMAVEWAKETRKERQDEQR